MGLVIIFAIVALFCLAGTFRSLKQKAMLAVFFAGASTLVFGWFAVMTFVGILGGHGVPAGH